jgi:predicted kinase
LDALGHRINRNTQAKKQRQGAAVLKKLVLMVGIPGSGKTTLSRTLIEKGYLCLNADSIRKELWGDENDQREPETVFGKFFAQLEEAMAGGTDIVIDNTNINRRHRQPILERAAKFGYQDVQLWVLDVPVEVCLERNRKRERNVPEDIVRNMDTTIRTTGSPKRYEGKLVIVKPAEKDFQFRFFLPK